MDLSKNKFAALMAPAVGLMAVALFMLRGPIVMGKSVLVTDISRYRPWGDGQKEYRDNPECSGQAFDVYPAKTLYKQEVGKGRLPAWSGLVKGGYPIDGDSRYGWFDPFNLMFVILPVEAAMKLLALLQLFLIGLFGYGYLREVGLKKFAAWFGGAAVMSSSFVLTHLPDPPSLQSVIWFPFLLWMFARMCGRCRPWPYIGIISLGVALSIFGGQISLSVTALMGFLLYGIGRIVLPGSWECLEPKKTQLKWLAASLAAGVLVASPQILPTWNLCRFSYWSHLFEGLEAGRPLWARLPSGMLATIFHPYLFGRPAGEPFPLWSFMKPGLNFADSVVYPGWAVLLPAIWAVRFKYRDRRVQVLGCLCVLSLLVPYGLPFLDPAVWLMSGFRSGGSNGFLFLFGVCFAFLAGFGLDDMLGELSNTGKRFIRFLVVISASCAALFIAISIGPPIFRLVHLPSESPLVPWIKDCIYTSLIALAASSSIYYLSRRRRRKWAGEAILVFVLLADVSRFAGGYLTFQDRGFKDFSHPSIEWLKNRAGEGGVARYGEYDDTFPSNSPLIYGIKDAQARTPAPLKRMAGYWGAIKWWNVGRHGEVPPLNGLFALRSKLLGALGVRYVLSSSALPQDSLEAGWERVYGEGMYIYENRRAYGPAWLVSDAKFTDGGEEAARMTAERDFDPSRTVVIESFTRGLGFVRGGFGEVRVIELSSGMARFDVNAPEGGWLVFSQAWYPGWKAQIGSDPTRIYKADGVFQAVTLNPGRFEVTFHYRPALRIVGYYFAAVAAYFIIMGFLWGLMKRRA